MHRVEPDGRRIDNIHDPPGQRSVYVPPGEPERETYRLSTFHHFPRDSPIDPRQFAAHGFYYTGYRDRVKCFSCGLPSENWNPGDDITLPEWHTDDCQLMRGTDTTNIPIGGSFLQRSHQTSQAPPFQQPTSNHHQSPSRINVNSRTRTLYQNPTTNHVQNTRSNESRIQQTNYETFQPPVPNHIQFSTRPRQGVVSSSVQSRLHSVRSQSNSSLLDTFPCLNPVNPHMRTKEARLQTFLDNSSLWPAHRIRATPVQIVDAGMYYLGERDRVKCWYCNGGLQNWERDDNPWEEHVKWFPLCEYVLQQKGPDYVHGVVARFPSLRRPNLTNPTNQPAAQVVTNAIGVNSSSSHRPPRQTVSAPQIVDPQAELRRINEQVEEEWITSPMVNNAKLMGFEERFIKAALKKQFQDNKQPFPTLEALVDAVLIVDVPSVGSPEESLPNGSAAAVGATTDSPGQELRRLEESRKCKKCHREDACVVFIPCGHLVCCVGCSEQVERCPVCREVIREKVRSYLS